MNFGFEDEYIQIIMGCVPSAFVVQIELNQFEHFYQGRLGMLINYSYLELSRYNARIAIHIIGQFVRVACDGCGSCG